MSATRDDLREQNRLGRIQALVCEALDGGTYHELLWAVGIAANDRIEGDQLNAAVAQFLASSLSELVAEEPGEEPGEEPAPSRARKAAPGDGKSIRCWMTIVLARVELGKEPRALLWGNGGKADLARARAHAATEGWTVLTYPTSERFPLEKARLDILDPARRAS